MLIAVLFIKTKPWNQPRCPTTDDWMNKIWYIYTREYYLEIRKNKTMLFVGKWMELEIIMLSKVS
jgi:hypothetical protein